MDVPWIPLHALAHQQVWELLWGDALSARTEQGFHLEHTPCSVSNSQRINSGAGRLLDMSVLLVRDGSPGTHCRDVSGVAESRKLPHSLLDSLRLMSQSHS